MSKEQIPDYLNELSGANLPEELGEWSQRAIGFVALLHLQNNLRESGMEISLVEEYIDKATVKMNDSKAEKKEKKMFKAIKKLNPETIEHLYSIFCPSRGIGKN